MIHTLVEFAVVYCGAAVVGYGALVLGTRRSVHRATTEPVGVPAPALRASRLTPSEQAA